VPSRSVANSVAKFLACSGGRAFAATSPNLRAVLQRWLPFRRAPRKRVFQLLLVFRQILQFRA